MKHSSQTNLLQATPKGCLPIVSIALISIDGDGWSIRFRQTVMVCSRRCTVQLDVVLYMPAIPRRTARPIDDAEGYRRANT